MTAVISENPIHNRYTPKTFSYPDAIKADFLKTTGIDFSDGTQASAAEIWRFMTEEGPRRFPSSFDDRPGISRLSHDVEFLSGINRSYFQLTLRDRALHAHEIGVPLVMTQGGQTMEVYYAAGAIPLRPGLVMQWARDMKEGLDFRQAEDRGVQILESGRSRISIEACNQIAAHAAVDNGIVPIDLIAPFLALRCSDMAYLVEAHRSQKNPVPLQFVDFPINQVDKPWAVELVAEELRKLVKTISGLSGKEVTDEVLWEHIRLGNTARQIARDITYQWWDAAEPPMNSTDFNGIFHLANDFVGDPHATITILEQIRDEVAERVHKGVRGQGVAKNAKRLFVCGSCVGPNATHIESVGAIQVGRDDSWNLLDQDVAEKGDPYLALAKGIVSYPYELPTEQRAEWTVDAIKRSRADGVLFMYNWGCNYQTGVARLISDIIKQNTGLPTTFIEVGELGRAEATEQSQNRVEAFIELL